MVPVGTVFQRFPRLVRDVAKTLGKQIELALHGEETELDKQVPRPSAIRSSTSCGTPPITGSRRPRRAARRESGRAVRSPSGPAERET